MLSWKAPFNCTLQLLSNFNFAWYHGNSDKQQKSLRWRESITIRMSTHLLSIQKIHTPSTPPPKLLTLPLCFSALSSPNASYGPLRNAPARFGNVIKGVRDAKGGQKGWHQADFTPGPRMARPKPGSSLRTADQKDCCTYADQSGKATKGMVKNANPQDKYILILLQYNS